MYGQFVLPEQDRDIPGTPSHAAVVAWLGLTAAVAGYVTLLVTGFGGPDTVVRVSDLAITAAALAAAVACARAGRRHLAGMAAFWWLLAAACAAWAAGEATWTWYEVVLRVPVPYPSWADVGYLAGTPLAVAAFLTHPAARHHTGRRAIPLLDGCAVATATLLVSWLAVLGPLVEQTGGLDLGDLVAIAYPVGDVVILVLVVMAVRGLPPGNRAAAVLLLVGLAVMAGTDSAYTYLVQNDAYASGDLIDAGWFAAYLAIGAAALVARESAIVDTHPRPRSDAAPGSLPAGAHRAGRRRGRGSPRAAAEPGGVGDGTRPDGPRDRPAGAARPAPPACRPSSPRPSIRWSCWSPAGCSGRRTVPRCGRAIRSPR